MMRDLSATDVCVGMDVCVGVGVGVVGERDVLCVGVGVSLIVHFPFLALTNGRNSHE